MILRHGVTSLSPPQCAARLLALMLPGALFAALPLTAQEGTSTPDATVSIQIDGRLDEATWAEAFVIDRFVQQRPSPGAPVSERTEVRILYDDENLYVGAEFYDSNPSGIVRSPLQRDGPTPNGDAFAISLDTFLDGRNASVFYINAGASSAIPRVRTTAGLGISPGTARGT